MTEIPASKVKRPHKVSFADLAARIGVDLDAPVVPDEEPYMTHATFGERCPAFADRDCRGTMRISDRNERHWFLFCDKCRLEVAIRAPSTVAQDHRHRLEQAGIPDMFLGHVFEESPDNQDAVYLARGWLSDYGKGDPMPALALYGEQGRGKSHLLAAICTRLVNEHDATVMFRSVRGLLRELQRFENEVERSATWERARTVDVLALDDLGAQRESDWRAEQLAELIDERYQAERPILIATNFKPADWGRTVDARTASRLRGMTVAVELRGPDRRQQSIPIEGAAA